MQPRLFYDRTKNAGETLHDNYLAFDRCHTALEMWSRFWGLDKGLSRRYQDALWGVDGSKTIGHQLAKIRNQMEDIWDELWPLLTRAGITQQTASQVDWSSTHEARRGVAKIKSVLRKRDLWWFGSGKGAGLLLSINSVWASISELRELSFTCFSLVNGTSLLNHSPDSLASAVGLKSFLDAVLDTKAAATMYFKALFDMIRVGIPRTKPGSSYPKIAQLDVNLVKKKFLTPSNWQTFDNIQLSYNLSLLPDHRAQHWQPLLVLVDGPHSLTRQKPTPFAQIPESKHDLGINDALHAAREFNTCLFAVRSPDDIMSACFRVLPPQSHQLLDLCPSGPLWSTATLWDLFDSYTDNKSILTLSNRLRLARDIVLTTLFLGGTPWLSGARHGIGRVVRPHSSDGGDAERFLLDVEVDGKVSEAMSLQDWRRHLHSAGLALLELGMDMQIRRVTERATGPGHFKFLFSQKRPHNDPPTGWIHSIVGLLRWFLLGPLLSRFSLKDPGLQLKLSSEEVNSKLTTMMGQQYAETVRQLLNSELLKSLKDPTDMKGMAKSCWEVYLR